MVLRFTVWRSRGRLGTGEETELKGDYGRIAACSKHPRDCTAMAVGTWLAYCEHVGLGRHLDSETTLSLARLVPLPRWDASACGTCFVLGDHVPWEPPAAVGGRNWVVTSRTRGIGPEVLAAV